MSVYQRLKKQPLRRIDPLSLPIATSDYSLGPPSPPGLWPGEQGAEGMRGHAGEKALGFRLQALGEQPNSQAGSKWAVSHDGDR
jgi:hypothetical protein